MHAYCSQTVNCVYILSFGKTTGCRDCCCGMTNGGESKGCSKASLETGGGPGQTTGCLSKLFFGWRALEPRGEICHRHSVLGIPRSDASLVGLTKACGKPSLLAYPRMRILKRSFSTAQSSAPTSTPQVRQKKGTTRSWPFSWGIEYQDSCGSRWPWQPEPVHSYRRRTP